MQIHMLESIFRNTADTPAPLPDDRSREDVYVTPQYEKTLRHETRGIATPSTIRWSLEKVM